MGKTDPPAKVASNDQLCVVAAAKAADWGQVVANGGPPCFHLGGDGGRFCLRADRWDGHGVMHRFVPLHELLTEVDTIARYKQCVIDGKAPMNMPGRPSTPVGWSDTDWLRHLETQTPYANGPLPETGLD